MKKTWKALAVALLLLLQACLPVVSLAVTNTDISVTGYDIMFGNVIDNTKSIYKNDGFKIKFNIRNNTAGPLNDDFVTVDDGSSFYIKRTEEQIKSLGNLAAGGTLNGTEIGLVYKGTGDTLKLVFSYNGGSESTQTLHIGQAVPEDNSPPPAPVDTRKYVPKPGVTGMSAMPSVRAGETLSLVLPIKNSSTFAVKNLSASIEVGGKSDFPFTFDSINLTQEVTEIAANDTKKLTFTLTAEAGTPQGIYPIKLNYRFSNAFGDDYTSSETIYVKVENYQRQPGLEIYKVTLDPQSARPGEIVKATFYIKNTGSLAARDVRVSLKGLKPDGFTVLGSTDVQHISGIEGFNEASVQYTLVASRGLAEGNQGLSIQVDYKDSKGTAGAEESQFFIPVQVEEKGSPVLAMENIQSPGEVLSVNKDFSVAFKLKNNGEAAAHNIKVWLTTDREIIPKSLSTVFMDKMEKGKAKDFNFILSAIQDAATKNYPIAINVEYEDLQGQIAVKRTLTQYVGAYVQNGASESKSVPKIIVDQFHFDKEKIKAGDRFKLTASFLNTNKRLAVGNIKVVFASDDGSFVPANSSTFYVERIAPGKRVERTIELSAKPDLAPKSYVISINFEYEDDKGNPYTAKEIISIPVEQDPRLVTNEVNLPPEAFVGQPVPVFVEFYNMGKATLYNLMVKTEGDFQQQNPGYFAGNFEPGRSDSFDGSVTPGKAGPVKGAVVFTFEDAAGKQTVIRKEFSMNVAEMQQPPMNPEGMPGKGMPETRVESRKVFNPLYMGAGGAVFLGIVIALILILRKRRNARKGLELDE